MSERERIWRRLRLALRRRDLIAVITLQARLRAIGSGAHV